VQDDNMRVIKDGLKPDDRVVVNGQARVRPGQKVKPEPKTSPDETGGPQAKAQ
jgi:multidrug efflux pump subunit AcrA (membrane-fusion protein)